MSDIIVGEPITIGDVDSLQSSLDAKQTTFAMNPTLITDSNLALSYFGNYRAVTREIDTDVTMTLNDDMKTGETFLYTRKNTHATLTRNVAVPLPRGGSSVFATVAGEYNDIFIRWDSKNAIWRFASSGSYAKVTS